ncbi:uncharacterized protein LOC128396446 [Panonychus citri]|uniref:uncharacterized protein LOC128396446 n=1 Tax=Panonychus citri TaxID=50023 RepID=UPI0023082FC7|nr:uncharacterized protein LOC128396446 [Panonychus citri]
MRISFKFIALAESISELYKKLKQNVKYNAEWRNLKKVINYTSEILEINIDPAVYENDFPDYVSIESDELNKLLGIESHGGEKNPSTVLNETKDSDKNPSEGRNCPRENEFPDKTKREKVSTTIQQELTSSSEESPNNKQERNTSPKRIVLNNILEKIRDLEKRKEILSNIDSSGIILRSVIDLLQDIVFYLNEKYQTMNQNLHHILTTDSTYKNTKKVS